MALIVIVAIVAVNVLGVPLLALAAAISDRGGKYDQSTRSPPRRARPGA
jgi:hypothetical protein